MTTAVFIHGAWHDSWSWNLVRSQLNAAGVNSAAIDVPMRTLDEDAAVLRAVLEDLGDDAVVVGHSWGGSVVTLGAAERPNVRHLVYIGAFMIEAGVPVQTERRATLGATAMEIDGDVCVINPKLAVKAFYDDVDAELASQAIRRLRPFWITGFSAVPVSVEPAWRNIPTTYVVCRQDNAINVDDQRDMAKRAGEVIEWDSSHSPFLSHPDLVADLVIDRVKRYA